MTFASLTSSSQASASKISVCPDTSPFPRLSVKPAEPHILLVSVTCSGRWKRWKSAAPAQRTKTNASLGGILIYQVKEKDLLEILNAIRDTEWIRISQMFIPLELAWQAVLIAKDSTESPYDRGEMAEILEGLALGRLRRERSGQTRNNVRNESGENGDDSHNDNAETDKSSFVAVLHPIRNKIRWLANLRRDRRTTRWTRRVRDCGMGRRTRDITLGRDMALGVLPMD